MLVRDFHEAVGQPAPAAPTQPTEAERALRSTLILEEVAEVIGALNGWSEEAVSALQRQWGEALMGQIAMNATWGDVAIDLAALTKELADLRYVTDGAAVAFGLPLDEAFEIVHASNMSKDPDPAGGKCIKGDNYQPAEPGVRRLLEERSARNAT